MTETAEATNIGKDRIVKRKQKRTTKSPVHSTHSNLIGVKYVNGSIPNLWVVSQLLSQKLLVILWVSETPRREHRGTTSSAQPASNEGDAIPQPAKVTDIGHVKVIVLKKLLGISLNPNAEESNIRIFEGGNHGRGM